MRFFLIDRISLWEVGAAAEALNPSYAVARVGSLVAKDLRSVFGQSLHYI
jgi:hypothetical protein